MTNLIIIYILAKVLTNTFVILTIIYLQVTVVQKIKLQATSPTNDTPLSKMYSSNGTLYYYCYTY